MKRFNQWFKEQLARLFKWSNKFVNKRFSFLIPFFSLIGAGTVIFWSGLIFYDLYKYQNENYIIHTVRASRGVSDSFDAASQSDRTTDERIGIFTGYTSRIEETDSSPYITADGTDLRKMFRCVVANNELEFGTKIEIEEIGVCEVHDRMNSRYSGDYFDVWFGDLQQAKNFGRREINYRIVE